ncbi:MAG: hypothetical protein NWF06_04670 [Candidatus Bathyarchaeota archaeon]|nr:hypothetical protein [Candidatus Bathyarchaeum sp.]
MQIKVLKDAKGKVLATVDQTVNPLVQVEPVATKGEKIELNVEATKNYEYNLPTFYKKVEKR